MCQRGWAKLGELNHGGACLDLQGLCSAQGTQDPSAPCMHPSDGGYVWAWREGLGWDQIEMIGFVVILFSSFL